MAVKGSTSRRVANPTGERGPVSGRRVSELGKEIIKSRGIADRVRRVEAPGGGSFSSTQHLHPHQPAQQAQRPSVAEDMNSVWRHKIDTSGAHGCFR